jgi:hypothetical protein
MIASRNFKTCFLLAAAFLLAGCAGGYGRVQWSDTVAQAFQNHEMMDGYRYFYNGRGNKPSAIVGVSPAYEFPPDRHWNEISPPDFRRMVDRMIADYRSPDGAYILDPEGRRAGVWYSNRRHATARFENGRIIVYPPGPLPGDSPL